MKDEDPSFVYDLGFERGVLFGDLLPQVEVATVDSNPSGIRELALVSERFVVRAVPPDTVHLEHRGEIHSLSLGYLWDKVGGELQFLTSRTCSVVAERIVGRAWIPQLLLEMKLSENSFTERWGPRTPGIAVSLEFRGTWFPGFAMDLVQIYLSDCSFEEALRVRSEYLLVYEGSTLGTYLEGLRWL